MKTIFVNVCAIVARLLAVFFILTASRVLAQEVASASRPYQQHEVTFDNPSAASSTRQMDHISVKVMGTTGSPVFLIPGISAPRATWDGIAPELAKTHLVYLVQINGFGGDAPGANLNPGILTGIVADLYELISSRKLNDVAVVGHSMGGIVGLMLAARHPASVERLMVVDELPFAAVMLAPPGADVTVSMVEPRAAQMRDATAAGYSKPADPAALQASVARLTLNPENHARLKEWAMAADPRVTARALYENLTTDLRPE